MTVTHIYTSDVQLIVVIVYMHYDVPVVSVTAAMHCLCCWTLYRIRRQPWWSQCEHLQARR